MGLIQPRAGPRKLLLKLKCKQRECQTVVTISGSEDDAILRQISKWGTTCPACGRDLDVVSRVTLPYRTAPVPYPGTPGKDSMDGRG